jgi:hypothetical protein
VYGSREAVLGLAHKIPLLLFAQVLDFAIELEQQVPVTRPSSGDDECAKILDNYSDISF